MEDRRDERPDPSGEWLPPEPPGGVPPQQPPPPPPAYRPQPPPGYASPQPPPFYQPQPPNTDAVVGFTCGVIGAALLFFSAGLSTIVSLVLGIVAIPYARKGKRVVAEGKTLKHKDLANAGYVLGIVTVVLSVLAIVVWILIFALVDWDEIDDTEEDPFEDDFQFQVALRVLSAAARLVS